MAQRVTVPVSRGVAARDVRREAELVAARHETAGVLRLTRRGRLVALVVVTLLVTLAFSAGRVTSNAATPEAPAAERTVVVAEGETLWSIATDVAPDRDPRETVAAIQAANGLDGGAIHPGQALLVPALR